MWRSWALITGLAALAPFTAERARGQVVEATPPGPGVVVGDRVRVGGEGYPWRVGSVTAVDEAGFGFAMEGGGNVFVPWTSAPVERSVGRGTRAKAGALVGMIGGAGVLMGAALSGSSGSGGFAAGSTDGAVGLALLLGGLVGGTLGALIGSSISTESWAPVEPGPGLALRSAPAAAAGPRLALSWTVFW